MTTVDMMASREEIADAIDALCERFFQIATTWLAWDGRPRVAEGSVFTPHKALRRTTDHLIDHLAQLDAVVRGAPTEPDRWLGRSVTLDSDWARFTEADLREARQRIARLTAMLAARVRSLSDDEWAMPASDGWTVAQVAGHVLETAEYAEMMGRVE